MTAHLMVGIDPGVRTGLAVWSPADRKLTMVATMGIIEAMDTVRLMRDVGSLHSVTVEDARMRKWFGEADARAARSGAGIREGVGSVKRDCAIWAEFVTSLTGVELRLSCPGRNLTKLDAQRFARLTGWTGRTSNHARDAALLVWGLQR